MATWKFTTAAGLALLVVTGPAVAQTTTDSARADGMKAEKKSGAMRGSGTAGAALRDEKVKAAQQALKDKGHDPGEVDGTMGPRTEAALRDFQKAQGMEVSGRLDAKTTQALGLDGTTSGAGASATSGSASPPTAAKSGVTKSGAAPSEGKK